MNISSLSYPGYHWVFPHHGTKFNVETVQRAIELFKKHVGESMRSTGGRERKELNEGLASLLSSNPRKDMKGAKEPFRDYQQLFTHLGILYPHQLVGGRLLLTPIGEQLANGRIDYPAFLFLQAFGYQYPNGASEKARVFKMYLDHNVVVKPFLLIYQVLDELERRYKDASEVYLRQDEISSFLVPQRDHNHINEIVSSILERRKLRFGDAPGLEPRKQNETSSEDDKNLGELTRTVSEFIQVIDFLPFFDVYPSKRRVSNKKIRRYIPEIERVGVREVQALVEIEASAHTFHNLTSIKSADRLAWFDYYSSTERRDRWDRRVEQLETLYVVPSPPPLKLREFSTAMVPLSTAPAETQRTPEEIAALQQQRIEAHQHTVEHLAQRLHAIGGKVTYDPQSIDLQASIGTQNFFFEIKSLAGDQHDGVQQVREAVGQLLEYGYRASGSDSVCLCVVLDRFPDTAPWIIHYLTTHVQMFVCWWDETSQQFQFPESCSDHLAWIAGS